MEITEQKTKPKVLVCRHCFKTVSIKLQSLKKHLKNAHNIIGLPPKRVRAHYCLKREVEGVKRAIENRKARNAHIAAQRAKMRAKREQAAFRKKAEIAEYKRQFCNPDAVKSDDEYRCGDIVNGAPYLRIMYTPMGGLNKKY